MTTQTHDLPEDAYPALFVAQDRDTQEVFMFLDPQAGRLWLDGRERIALVTYEAVAMHEVNQAVSISAIH